MLFARRLLLLVLAASAGLLSALTIAACGADEEPTAEADEEVQLRVTNTAIDPNRVEVEPGTIRFVVDNDSQNTHELAIETPNGIERSGAIEAGDSGSLTIELSEGEYPMYDPREDFRQRGVAGVVVVAPETDTVTEEQTVTEEETDTVTQEETDTVTEQDTVTQQETVTQEGGETAP
jgi:iron uptake system EfeUOB component EfeO/EfeM